MNISRTDITIVSQEEKISEDIKQEYKKAVLDALLYEELLSIREYKQCLSRMNLEEGEM